MIGRKPDRRMLRGLFSPEKTSIMDVTKSQPDSI